MHPFPRFATVLPLLASALLAQLPPPEAERTGRALLKEMIETDTTHSKGDTTALARAIARRMLDAGFPSADVQVVGDTPKRGNLVVRYRGSGSGRPPVLFIAHLDVVEARREDWSVDPFALLEKDGYYYGRGTLDVKGGGATLAAAFVRLRGEGFVPDRDLILALTADEEGGDDNGIDWLLTHRCELIDAAYAINVDAGGGELVAGRVVVFDVQAAEKVYVSFTVTAHNAGGHSSLPVRDNAIYRLAAGLTKLAEYSFPVRLNDVTRAYFEHRAAGASGAEAADLRAVAAATPDAAAAARLSAASPFFNALLRTTCVATLLEGGHAENALPQTARATVNCRVLPGEDVAAVRSTLESVIGDPQLEITMLGAPRPSPPSPLAPEVFGALERVTRSSWGSVPIVPQMSTGATDSLYLRNAGMPVYGLTGISYEVDDDRSHGRDERMLVRSFSEGLEFAYRLMKALAAPAR
jgi:acetylornithine deacetylase/succinyl-diaminopimelate desuccinylase-like protein